MLAWMRNFLKKASVGQGTLEFALVIPVLLLVIFAIFEGARAVFIYQSIATASREAARLGSAASECVENLPDFPCYGDNGKKYYLACDLILNKALEYAGVARSTASDIRIYYLLDGDDPSIVDETYKTQKACGVLGESGIDTGDRIVVEVTGYFDPASAIPLMRIPQMTFSSITRRTILKSVEVGQALPAGMELAQWLPVSALR